MDKRGSSQVPVDKTRDAPNGIQSKPKYKILWTISSVDSPNRMVSSVDFKEDSSESLTQLLRPQYQDHSQANFQLL